MKKYPVFAMLSLIPALAGCGGSPTASGGFVNTSRDISLTTTVNVNRIKRGFIISSGRANEIVDYGDYHTLSSLSIADKYYLVYEFEYYSRQQTDGHLLLHAALEFDAVTIFDAQVIESDSGADATPIPYRDQYGNQIKKIDQTFRIPENADEVVKQRIIFKINPTSSGTSTMRMNFYPEEQSGVYVIGSGADGCTIPMDVTPYKIEAPVIRYENELKWNHVKGADYYLIYADDNSLKTQSGEDYKFLPAENLDEGEELTFNRFDVFGIYGDQIRLKVAAFSNRAGIGFTNSNPSNVVVVNI